MLTSIHPKLPMRNKAVTRAYYSSLGFTDISAADYPNYLIMRRDEAEIHFFLHPTLNPADNYGQVYIRTSAIAEYYNELLANHVVIHPNGALTVKPWGQQEFSLLDPDHNLLTFGAV